ncbi:MAG: ATP-dependent helicase [Candidatus Nanoarchaeia archaeon]
MPIEIEKTEYKDEYLKQILHPLISTWFFNKFKTFSLAQRKAIPNIHKNENTLISAPTGSGKTFGAFLTILSELISLAEKGQLENKTYCVYCSPLKALNRDIQKNLLEPLKDIEKTANKNFGIRVLVRTEDTTQTERTKMLKEAPHILITTPETLAILLVAPKFRNLLKDVRWVIIDEIHAFASNKRGAHLSISLERLQNLAGPFVRIGLSATIQPLELVAKFLVGLENENVRSCKIIDAQFDKRMDIKVLCPVKDIMKVSEKQLENSTYELIHKLIQSHKTTLIFTNTRAATERVVYNLKQKYAQFYNENIEAHHSSLSKDLRILTENKLKAGDLKVVVSSTSLELGIDVGSIDCVILLGSPKSISRAVQRIGRSGHNLNDTIKGYIIATDRDDLVEDLLIAKCALEKEIDSINIIENALDVLAQHIFGMAIEEKQHIETLYVTIKRSYCYRNLSKEDFISVIKYLAGDYSELEYQRVFAKIWYDAKTGFIGRRSKLARVIYSTNIGTIPDESFILVKQGDRVVGKIDEEFLERLKKNDIFVLGGQTYKFMFSRGMVAQVEEVSGKTPTIPSWYSEMLPLSFEVANEISIFRRLIEEKFNRYVEKEEIIKFISTYLHVKEETANSVYSYFKEQWEYAELPTDKKLLIENLVFDNKHYIIFHACFGRKVNDALSRAIAYVAAKLFHTNILVSVTDQNFYLVSKRKLNTNQILDQMKKENLCELLKLAIDNTDIFKRRFRHCAGRSLLIIRNYKGHKKSVGRQQVSSQILINACKRSSKDFPILKEAYREVLYDLMDLHRAQEILNKIKNGEIRIKQIETLLPSPFALNLIARGYSDLIKAEDRLEFIKKVHTLVLAKINQNGGNR